MEKNFEKISSIEQKKRPEIYFSVSNLVRHCHVKKNDGTEEIFDVLVRGKDMNGKPKYQALGGGAKISKEVITKMKEKFREGIRFRGGEEADDIRFYLPIPEGTEIKSTDSAEKQKIAQQKYNTFVSGVLLGFTEYAVNTQKIDTDKKEAVSENFSYEADVSRELEEELKKIGVLTSGEDIQDIVANYTGTVSPMRWKETTSSRLEDAAGYERIFNLFDIKISEAIFNRMKNSENIKILSKEEIEAIKQAKTERKAAAELPDGSIVVENVFPNF